METNHQKRILLYILRNPYESHTVTSLSQILQLSRVGIWKILKKLESQQRLILKPIGKGKTNTFLITFNWNNLLTEKTLALYLTEEALQQPRWRNNFKELEDQVDFLILFGSILHSPQQAHDIDLIGIVPKKENFVKIQHTIDKIQKTQSKKIHLINFMEQEFRQELQQQNRAFLDALKKGIILFGQENLVKFMKGVENKWPQ